MSAPASPPRTAAALAARERRVKDMLQRIEATVAELRHRHTAVSFQAVARKAGVSRTFLYENPEARKLIETARERGEGAGRPERQHSSEAEVAWRERALNAEDGLKTAHAEIRRQRSRMGQLLGQIRDLEARWSDESVTHLVEQNAQLKQRVQQLSQDQRQMEERLQATRTNNRFQDRRIAQLEAQLLEHTGGS
ncbi:hypothetical protein IAG44_15130 [Streptomyces roseirectus]|uniref:Transposase n=1 Tax=Streptomyces roseirectus TaxID=2768066 RepID=A0A7H0ICX2_9ACTN|nr:DUF6262 family protein [Streptomyces roseirectus]QNP70638.1 hypothetical protein IAG44_15130 [Streptomyces roseirectus]